VRGLRQAACLAVARTALRHRNARPLAASEAIERQIDEVAARALSDPSLDDAARVERIREGVDALSEKLSPTLVRKALAGVPVRGLTFHQESSLEYTLHNIKWHTSDSLAHFKTGGRVTLAQYWAVTHPAR
jgi:hypothetical protein